MKDSLLSHITSNFVPQYENVANSSICYLLNKYPSAQQALMKMAGCDQPVIQYVTELSTDTNGRPDITGLDKDGNKVIIIEGKFWANLTENQPNNYLDELGDNGILIFLAPDKRLDSLNSEINKRVVDKEDDRIQVYSWVAYLDSVEIENSKQPDFSLQSDLTQVRELCATMDEEGIPPLNLTDLDPMNGRIFYQLTNVLDDCKDRMKLWSKSDFTGLKATPGKYGAGFYFRAYGYGCYLSISSRDWFLRKSHTPIWLSIWDYDFKKSDSIYHALLNYDGENAYDEKGYVKYGITLQAGMDRNMIVYHITESVRNVLKNLQN